MVSLVSVKNQRSKTWCKFSEVYKRCAILSTGIGFRVSRSNFMAIHGNSSQHSTSMSLPPQLLHTLDSLKDRAKDAVWALTSCLCQQSATVKINGRTCQYPRPCQTITCLDFYIVKIVKVLGEGGFSFVYLVQDESSGVSTHCQFVVVNLIICTYSVSLL